MHVWRVGGREWWGSRELCRYVMRGAEITYVHNVVHSVQYTMLNVGESESELSLWDFDTEFLYH